MKTQPELVETKPSRTMQTKPSRTMQTKPSRTMHTKPSRTMKTNPIGTREDKSHQNLLRSNTPKPDKRKNY
jgi:hypothetical protein